MSTLLTHPTSEARQHWVVGNWKMNPTFANAQQLTLTLAKNLTEVPLKKCKTAIAPMSIHLIPVLEILKNNQAAAQIQLVAQDIAVTRNTGAFTGDISVDLIKETGVEWIIVGHSERRTIHDEHESVINLKLTAAVDAGLGVIWCVGETLLERETGRAVDVVSAQINAHRDILTKIDPSKLLIAYEPVWAIGTGCTASPEDAQQMHAVIRQLLAEIRISLIHTSLLYGGSVKSDNAASLAACADIDGALVGGASLDAESFLQIAQAFDIA
jgi:triosephosphate isomerase (TIM)